MYSFIEGELVYADPSLAVIKNFGIGYEIKISLTTYSNIKTHKECKLHTYLHVREDAHTLFGFYDLMEKKIFLDLIAISGVGTSTALTILSYLTPGELADAILNDNAKSIQNIKGIGPKTAQRIVLELKDKLKKEQNVPLNQNKALSSQSVVRQDALQALVSSGIPKATAEKTIDSILASDDSTLTTEQLIKIALRSA